MDYKTIGNWVQLAGGERTNSIVINPINRGQTNVETVTLTLAPSMLMTPVNYEIGSPKAATVYIAGTALTNVPPVVRITSPPDGAVFRAPLDLPLFAYAADPDGTVASVEFFANGSSLGLARRVTAVPPPLPPGPIQPPIMIAVPTNCWGLLWTNVPIGEFKLTAVATDDDGAATTSGPVKIAVLPSPPPPTNRPPLMSIVATDPIAIEGTNWWRSSGAAISWTNWGPKNATFTVTRFGDTNMDLTVTYAIGGTATNGVDYLALPGWVTSCRPAFGLDYGCAAG